MIISRTPFRISFFGDGTDNPAWFREHGGSVLSSAINKFGHLTCRNLPPFFEHRHRIVYSKVELVQEVAEIKHPAVKAAFEYMNIQQGLEIHYDGDLPAFAGIGSSSSFTVGLLNTLHALKGLMRSKFDLATEALHIEQTMLKETHRSQDQILAAYGGLNRINFLTNGSFEVLSIGLPQDRMAALRENHLLFFTGFAAHERAPRSVDPKLRHSHLSRKKQIVDEAEKLLRDHEKSLAGWGPLLHEEWQLNRELADKATHYKVDEVYDVGIKAGATGGRILGRHGGFILFHAPLAAQAALRDKLSSFIEVPFDFEESGSKIILYQPAGMN